MTTLREAATQALKFLEDGDFVYPTELADNLKAALAESPDSTKPVAESEPVAWLAPRNVDSYSRPDLGYETCSKTDYGAFPVYTAPTQRKPLTEKEIDNIWDSEKAFADIYAIVRAIEAKHGIV